MQEMICDIKSIFPSGHTQWDNYILGCIDAEICPVCGSELICNEPLFVAQAEKPVLFTCLNCDWHEYA